MDNSAEAVHLLQDCVKHRREIAGRAVDDPQYLRGRGLLLQGFAGLGQKARVLHRYDRLRREILQQCDLLVRKWTHFLAVERDRTQRDVFLTQWGNDEAASAGKVDYCPGQLIAGAVRRIGSQITNRKCTFALHHSSRTRPGAGAERSAAEFGVCFRDPVERPGTRQFAIKGPEDAEVSLTKPRRLFQHHIEHWCQVTGRGIDDLQYLSGRSLLLQGFARLGEQPRVLAIVTLTKAGSNVPTNLPTTTVVESGPYRFTRNPIHLGMFLGLIALAIAFDNLWLLMMLGPFALPIRYGVVAREEAYLKRKFGDVYRGYHSRVRRWL